MSIENFLVLLNMYNSGSFAYLCTFNCLSIVKCCILAATQNIEKISVLML